MQLQLGAMGVEAVGMNKGGTFEAAGIGFTMVRADHTGGMTLTDGDAPLTRELGCWGWVMEFEDGTTVYHSGDTDLFGDMQLIGERFSPEVAVLPIGGHYTMGPRDAGRAADLVGASTVIPVHYATLPVLAGTPDELREHTAADVVLLEPGETWEAEP
ncbi:MAG: MBL fold metallo-hydrolase, partial [Chloroflexi bacterium]|nr:MBL fold metallo-hydrolase [Chloroflexota bacterium]